MLCVDFIYLFLSVDAVVSSFLASIKLNYSELFTVNKSKTVTNERVADTGKAVTQIHLLKRNNTKSFSNSIRLLFRLSCHFPHTDTAHIGRPLNGAAVQNKVMLMDANDTPLRIACHFPKQTEIPKPNEYVINYFRPFLVLFSVFALLLTVHCDCNWVHFT